MHITLDLPRQQRIRTIAALRRYFDEHMPEPIGELPTARLLDFLLEELGPVLYNLAVADIQAHLLTHVHQLSTDLHAEPVGRKENLEPESRLR